MTLTFSPLKILSNLPLARPVREILQTIKKPSVEVSAPVKDLTDPSRSRIKVTQLGYFSSQEHDA